jgi:hypothetical protein
LIESKADCIPNSLARSRHVSNPGCLSESSLRCSASVRTQTLAALNAIRTICPTELRAIQKIRLSRRCGHSNLLLRAMFRHAECPDCAMGASQTDCSGRSAMTAVIRDELHLDGPDMGRCPRGGGQCFCRKCRIGQDESQPSTSPDERRNLRVPGRSPAQQRALGSGRHAGMRMVMKIDLLLALARTTGPSLMGPPVAAVKDEALGLVMGLGYGKVSMLPRVRPQEPRGDRRALAFSGTDQVAGAKGMS